MIAYFDYDKCGCTSGALKLGERGRRIQTRDGPVDLGNYCRQCADGMLILEDEYYECYCRDCGERYDSRRGHTCPKDVFDDWSGNPEV